MERNVNGCGNDRRNRELADGWEAWEAVPRDGPAVFVIDARTLQHQGRLRGRWIALDVDASTIKRQVSDLLGTEPLEGTWAIVDQVGLGPTMVPEVIAVDELPDLPTGMTVEHDG